MAVMFAPLSTSILFHLFLFFVLVVPAAPLFFMAATSRVLSVLVSSGSSRCSFGVADSAWMSPHNCAALTFSSALVLFSGALMLLAMRLSLFRSLPFMVIAACAAAWGSCSCNDALFPGACHDLLVLVEVACSSLSSGLASAASLFSWSSLPLIAAVARRWWSQLQCREWVAHGPRMRGSYVMIPYFRMLIT